MARKTPDDEALGMVKLLGCRCRCGHEWLPRTKGERPAVCPKCKSELDVQRKSDGEEQSLDCPACRLSYPVEDGIPVMLVEEARPL